jgi:hypothetical protein
MILGISVVSSLAKRTEIAVWAETFSQITGYGITPGFHLTEKPYPLDE